MTEVRPAGTPEVRAALSRSRGTVTEFLETLAGERIEQAAFAVGLRAQELRLNTRIHHRQVDRLRHKIVDALAEGVDDGYAIFHRAHHDDGELAGRISRAQQAQQVEPAHARHHLIEQDQIVMGVIDLIERLLAVFSDLDLIATVSQAA